MLSPSTIDTDRGPKLAFHKSLPTVRHIVLVYQDQKRVEHYRRTETGFDLEVLTEAGQTLELDAVAFGIAVGTIYFGAEV